MSAGATIEGERRRRLLDQAFGAPPREQTRRERLLGEAFAEPEPDEDLSAMMLGVQMAQGFELEQPDPDRPIPQELGVGVVRGYAGLIEARGGLVKLAAGQLERVVGDNPLSRFLTNIGDFDVLSAAITRARFPRSEEPGFTARRTIGDLGEALPSLFLQAGTGFAGKPLGTLAQVGLFAATGAGQAVGNQYVAALAATGNPNLAATEAGAAGLIVLGLNSIPGFAAFRKFKGSQRFFMDAAMRVSRRMALVGVTESLEEMSEAVLIDTFSAIARDDPVLFDKIFKGDPEYWSDVLRQGIAGFFAGTNVGLVLGGLEVRQREELISKVTEIIETTGTLRADQLRTSRRFLAIVNEAQRTRDVAARFRRRVAGEPEPEVIPVEPQVDQEFVGEERRVRVVSVSEGQITYQEKPGETMTVERAEFARRFEPADTRRVASAEQVTRQAARALARAAVKGETTTVQLLEDALLDQLSRVRQEAESQATTIDAAKGTLIQIIRENVEGKHVPKTLLTEIKEVKTIAGLRRGIRAVRQVVAKQRRAKAIASAQKAVAKAAKSGGFRTEILRGLRAVARGFKQAGLSKQGQARVARLIATLQNAPPDSLEAELGKQLQKLAAIEPSVAPTEEIRQIASAIETQAAIASLRKSLTRKAHEERIRELASEIANEMAAHVNPKKTARGRILNNAQGSITSLFRLTFGLIEKMELDTLSEFLGGEDSTTWRALFRAIELGQRDGMGGYYESMDRLSDFMQNLGVAFGSEELTRLSNELTGVSTTLGATLSALGVEAPGMKIEAKTRTITLENEEELELFPAEIMGLAAITADEETRAMIIERGTPVRFAKEPVGKSRKLTEADLTAILAQLRPAERSIVDFMVRELNGPVKDTMRAWSIQELGFDITKPETWWTRHRILEGKPEDPATLDNLREKFLRTVGIHPGLTRARGKDIRTPIEVRDIFVDFNTVVWQTNMVAHLAPALNDARSILRLKPVREVLANSRASRASRAYEAIFDQIAREITGAVSMRGLAVGMFDPIIRRLPRGLLGLNPRIAAYQVVSAVMAQSEIPMHFLIAAASGGFDAEVGERMNRDPLMRMRMETSVMGIINEGSELGRKMLGFGQRGEGPMFLIRIMDRVAVQIVWRAAELQAESEGLEGSALRDRTWQIGERAISRTQPMFDSVHIAERSVEARASGGLFRLTNFFRAQRNKIETMVIRSVLRIQRSSDRKTIDKEVINIAVTVVGNTIAIASIRNIMTVGALSGITRALFTGEFPDEEEREAFYKSFAANLIRTFAGIPFLGDWIGGFVIRVLLPSQPVFDPEFTLIEGMIADAGMAFSKARKGLTEGEIRRTLEGAAQLFGTVAAFEGIPVLPIIRFVINVIDELIEEDSSLGSTPP